MIELTRLNGSPLAVNCDLIKYAEAAPDTVLTLITGEKLVVLEPCSEVSQRTLAYRAAVLRQAWPEAESALNAKFFLHKSSNGEATLAQIVSFANKARRSGIVSLDADLPSISDPFLRQALMLAVDGTEPAEVRKLELDNKSEIEEKIPAVFEAAGGYSPTVGIIGAVLGLIQVMKNLSNIDEVGRGIAVAFVATIYGVAMANLVCLPAAGKLKFRHREEQMIKEMALEGVISILEGMNPRMIETKLRTYLFDSEPAESARHSEVGA